MAITRAVGKIEHEAALEAKRSAGVGVSNGPAQGRKKMNTTSAGKKPGAPTGKRPAPKATLSGEQVHGLMS